MGNFIQDDRGYIAGGVALSALYPAARVLGFYDVLQIQRKIMRLQIRVAKNEGIGTIQSQKITYQSIRFKKNIFNINSSFYKKWMLPIDNTDAYWRNRPEHISVKHLPPLSSEYYDAAERAARTRPYLFRNIGWVAGILTAAGLVYWALTPSEKQ